MSAKDAIRRITKIVNGERQNHPFDFINNTAFYSFPVDRTDESVRRRLAQARLFAIGGEIGRGKVASVMKTTAITSGLDAYLLQQQNKTKALERSTDGWMTVQDMKWQVDFSLLMDKVTLPAWTACQRDGDDLERLLPDHGIIAVTDSEGGFHQIFSNPAMSQGAGFQDPFYESYWVPRVYRSVGMILGGGHAASRNANPEEITADIIQCGLADDLREGLPPGKDYFIIAQEDGQPVTLTDRAWETAKHIVDVVEKGFKTDFALAALIARFQIDDWLNGPDHGPLDMDKVSPALAHRSEEEKTRMRQLKEMMLPYIAEKCLSWSRYDEDPGLRSYVESHILSEKGKFKPGDSGKLVAEIFSYAPKGGANRFLHDQYNFSRTADDFARRQAVKKGGLASKFAGATERAVKRRNTDGVHFKDQARLFDTKNKLFKKLSLWEQAGVPFLADTLEGTRTPESAPAALFYACHPKGGMAAKEWADKRGIVWLKEAQSAADNIDDPDSFPAAVIAQNRARSEEIKEQIPELAGEHGIRNELILSTVDFQDFNDAVEANREFVATQGSERASRLSSNAVLALQMEWFDRNAQGLVLNKGWQYHPDDVRMVVRAVQHAVGLTDRCYEGGKYRMEIFVADPDAVSPADRLKKQDLYDLISTLGAHVEQSLDNEAAIPDRDTYVACAQLLEISDKLLDPGALNYKREQDPKRGKVSAEEIIDWKYVDSAFYRFWDNEPGKRAALSATAGGAESSLRDRLRNKILAKGVQFFADEDDLEGLHYEYRRAWAESDAKISMQYEPGKQGAQTLNLEGGPA